MLVSVHGFVPGNGASSGEFGLEEVTDESVLAALHAIGQTGGQVVPVLLKEPSSLILHLQQRTPISRHTRAPV